MHRRFIVCQVMILALPALVGPIQAADHGFKIDTGSRSKRWPVGLTQVK